MAERWYPAAQAAPVSYLPQQPLTGYPNRGVLHCTEGFTFAGSYAVYKAALKAPQFTCSFERGFFEIWQHFPVDTCGYALRNAAGGYHTNRAGICVQLEIVGTCDRNHPSIGRAPEWAKLWKIPRAYADGIRGWMRWVERQTGIRPEMPVTFLAYPDSYGNRNGQRLTGEQWARLNSWCSHQNVPEGNVHGDFGDCGSESLPGGARYLLPIEEDDMPLNDADKAWLTGELRRQIADFWHYDLPSGSGQDAWTFTYNASQQAQAIRNEDMPALAGRLDRVEAALAALRPAEDGS